MKKIILLTLFLFPFINSYAEECTCFGSQNFCAAITDDNADIIADVIFRGTFVGYDGGIKLEVDHVIHGDMNQNDIAISPTLCDVYPIPLIENDDYIFAVRKLDSSYFLMFCSVSYLRIEDEVVIGPIAPGVESIDYSDWESLNNCGEQYNLFPQEEGLIVYPNPTNDFLKIENTSPFNSFENVQIELMDMTGRELYTFKKDDKVSGGETWTINLQNFTAGVYFLKLTANNNERMIKIVKH